MINYRSIGDFGIASRRALSLSSLWSKPQPTTWECKAGPETHCIYDMCAIRPGTAQPCVVIIGGGMAGLSAANRLIQCGITNFRILEAMDSPGGRVRTCWIGDTVAEAGWTSIEGASLANPLFTLAAQERLIPVPVRRLDEDSTMVLTSEGRALDSRMVERAKQLFAEVETEVSEPAPPFPRFSSLAERMQVGLNEKMKDIPDYARWDVTRAIHGFMGALRTKLGHAPKELCPNTLSNINTLPGGKVQVKGGMTSLLAPLVRNLPAGALLTCKPVHTVLWGTAGPGIPRALVRTCDGENFPADYVIVTVPLGVLKASGEKMFCPQMPAFKVEAVRGLGFGNVNKIFLKFDSPFWSDEGGDMLLAWSPEELDEEESWIKGVTEIEMIPGSKKVMSLSVSGDSASKVESLTDSEIANGVGMIMKRFFGSSLLPRPTEVLSSSWHASPYFGGFKTYLRRGAGLGMITSLARPLPSDCDDLPPIILFAGEHTHPEFFGTLHGSRLSGIREADRIVKLTKIFNGPPDKGPACIPCS